MLHATGEEALEVVRRGKGGGVVKGAVLRVGEDMESLNWLQTSSLPGKASLLEIVAELLTGKFELTWPTGVTVMIVEPSLAYDDDLVNFLLLSNVVVGFTHKVGMVAGIDKLPIVCELLTLA